MSQSPARLGTWELQVRFYTQTDGNGSLVGTASAQVLLRADGSLAKPDGSSIGTIDPAGTIATVQIAPSQRVIIGQTVDLTVNATDASNNVIAVPPGAIFYQVLDGSDKLQIVNGQLKGVASGPATVTVTIDGKKSQPQTVYVTPDIPTQVVSLQTNDIIYDKVTQKIYASVPSSAGAPRGNTITIIDPSTATIGASIPVGSEPGKLALSDDGKYLYVALNGAAAIRRIDMATLTPDLQFAVGSDPFFGSFRAGDIAVLPSQPTAIAVSLRQSGSPSFAGLTIFDNGVPRLNKVSQFPVQIDSITFGATANRLYGYNNETTGYDFTRMNVDANGVTVQDHAGSIIQGFSVTIVWDNGLVYASNGQVIDPEARTLTGTYNLGGSPFLTGAFLPDMGAGRTYFVVTDTSGAFVTLRVFDQKSFVQVSSAIIPIATGQPGAAVGPRLVKWGANGLAFNTSAGQVVILAAIPNQ